jgi:hypothetical protein
MKQFQVCAILSIVLFSSCHFFEGRRIDGNGNVTIKSRPVSDFNGVDVSGGIDLYITQDFVFSALAAS